MSANVEKSTGNRALLGVLAHYWALLQGYKVHLAWLLLASLVGALMLGILTPILIMRITDEGVVQRNVEALVYYISLGALVLLVAVCSRYFIRVRRVSLRNALVKRLTNRMLGDFYRLPYRSVLKNDSGYFVSRIYDEATRAVEPVLQVFVDLSVTGLSMLASLAVVVTLSWRVALLVCIGIPLFLLLSRWCSARIRESWREATEREAIARGLLERLVDTHRLVNIFGLQPLAGKTYDGALSRQMEKLLKNARYSAIFSSTGTGFVNWTVLLVLAYSGYEVIAGVMTMGGMIAITTIYSRMVGYAQTLVNAVPGLHNAQVAFDRIMEFANQSVEAPLLPVKDDVVIKDLGFAYNSDEVLRDLSLTIRKGERVLVLGSNATGKTTLAHVIASLLPPTSGKAEVPGLQRISAAFFPPDFVPGDVAQNLDLEGLSDEKKELFCKVSQILEIEGLSGEDPQELSAGQRQKVSVLRALLKEADLYIFDEPFSNVDSKSKGKLFQAILEATRGKSLLMTMHGEKRLHAEFDHVIDLDRAGASSSRRGKGALAGERT